jgi:glycosyltransferase involved in cell wall biosynthesis
MKILFVVTSLPFPPRQGVELPLHHIIERLSKSHTVDVLIIARTKKDQSDFASRRLNVPTSVRNTDILYMQKQSRVLLALRELIGIAPTFFLNRFNERELRQVVGDRHYDLAWLSPIGCLGLLHASRRLGLLLCDNVAVGHNDVTVSLYWDGFKQFIRGRIGMDWQRVFMGLRVPLIWLYERRYLHNIDLIHVQTELEKRRMVRVIGKKGRGVRIVGVSNGRKKELEAVCYRGKNSKRIVFMTHLSGGRCKESEWFLKQVWPRVLRSIPDAQLWLVGTPPENHSEIKQWLPPNVKICGYVDSLVEMFDSVALSVVPTLHGTGWINRIADSLVAGVPTVACPEPLATIPGLEIGAHALKGGTGGEFADNVIRLLSNEKLREKISKNARQLASSFPTWEHTVRTLEAVLEEVIMSKS